MMTTVPHHVVPVNMGIIMGSKDPLVLRYDLILYRCSATCWLLFVLYYQLALYSTTYRGLQAILDLQDLLEHQVAMDPMVKMENLVMVVHQEQRDLQDILESASIYQVLLVDPEKKEIKENQESLVLLAIMAILEPPDLMENLANMHHLVSQVFLVNREGLVKMAVQDSQEYLVEKDRKAELLDWKNFKTKSLMASNHFE